MRRLMLIGLVLFASQAAAAVRSSSPSGFQVEHKLQIAAAPQRVYAGITDIGRWWSPAHSWSGKASNLSLSARAGGCFCETLANGGSVQHMQVVFAAPAQMLRLTGGLGPLQGEGVAGSWTFALAPAQDGAATDLVMSYTVGGYASLPLDQLAAPVDGVLLEQLTRLKQWLETGKPQ